MNKELSLIVAKAKNGVIGASGDLPWGRGMKSDLARFKKITTEAGTIVMGRKTFDSITGGTGRLLPGRLHLVLSRTTDFPRPGEVGAFTSAEAALQGLKLFDGACVIGGAQIYELFLPHVSRIHLTEIDAEPAGDAYFPELSSEWQIESETPLAKHDERDTFASVYREYVRAQ